MVIGYRVNTRIQPFYLFVTALIVRSVGSTTLGNIVSMLLVINDFSEHNYGVCAPYIRASARKTGAILPVADE